MVLFIVVVIVSAYIFYAIRRGVTGVPGPFDTVTYTDDGTEETYKEIIGHLERNDGPNIIVNMSYSNEQEPNHYQDYLIKKSKEEKSEIKINLYYE